MSENAKRDLYINARSLILKALDIMDKAYGVGKYKGSTTVPSSTTETIAGMMDTSPRITTTVKQT